MADPYWIIQFQEEVPEPYPAFSASVGFAFAESLLNEGREWPTDRASNPLEKVALYYAPEFSVECPQRLPKHYAAVKATDPAEMTKHALWFGAGVNAVIYPDRKEPYVVVVFDDRYRWFKPIGLGWMNQETPNLIGAASAELSQECEIRLKRGVTMGVRVLPTAEPNESSAKIMGSYQPTALIYTPQDRVLHLCATWHLDQLRDHVDGGGDFSVFYTEENLRNVPACAMNKGGDIIGVFCGSQGLNRTFTAQNVPMHPTLAAILELWRKNEL